MPLDESPIAVLYDENGISLAVSGGVATSVTSSALLVAGINDAGLSSIIKLTPSRSLYTVISDAENGLQATVGADNVLRVGRDVLLFQDFFDLGVNPNIWTENSNSAAANYDTTTSGALTLHVSASAASGLAWQLETAKKFVILTHWPTTFGTRLKFNSYNTGSIFSFGLLSSSIAPGSPNAGYFFRLDATGSLGFVINHSGTEFITPIATNLEINDWHNYHAEIGESRIVVTVEDTQFPDERIEKVIQRPNYLPQLGFSHIPFVYRLYNTAVTTGALDISVDHVGVLRNDLDSGFSWEHVMAGMGRNCVSDPFTFNQATNFVVNAGPATASYSTTTPMYTTLGGNFAVAAVTGFETDYNLFGYQIPEGFQLFLRTITINIFNFGAANAGTPTVAQFALGVNSNTPSLLTPAPRGPRVIPLGTTFLDVNVKVGSVFTPSPIIYSPSTPITVDSGKYFHILLRVPVGLATNNQIIRGSVAVDGFFH